MFALTPDVFSLLGDVVDPYASFPEAASTFASSIDWLYWFITIVCILFFIPIAGCLFFFAYKYHKPKGGKAESKATHNTPLELAWSILPSFFLIGMFVMGAQSYLDIRTVPDGANQIGVKAFKWGWTMDYGGGTFHPELHILLDEPVKLTMRSSDVIHSLYVPSFRAKKDIVPGRFNYMWFKPIVASEKVSEEKLAEAKQWTKDSGQPWDYDKWQFTSDGYTFFDLFCAEYCGKNHSQMQTAVVVHKTQDELDAWVKEYSARQEGVTPAEYGKLLYERRGCTGCHSTDGSKRVGPSFKDVFGSEHGLVSGGNVKVDENYVIESIVYPKAKIVAGYQPVMPSFKGQLSDDDLYCLVEFLKSISATQGATAAPTTAAPTTAARPPRPTTAAPTTAAPQRHHRSANHRSANHRSADRSANHRSANHRSANHRSANHRSADHRSCGNTGNGKGSIAEDCVRWKLDVEHPKHCFTTTRTRIATRKRFIEVNDHVCRITSFGRESSRSWISDSQRKLSDELQGGSQLDVHARPQADWGDVPDRRDDRVWGSRFVGAGDSLASIPARWCDVQGRERE